MDKYIRRILFTLKNVVKKFKGKSHPLIKNNTQEGASDLSFTTQLSLPFHTLSQHLHFEIKHCYNY